MTISQNQTIYRNPFGSSEGYLQTENGGEIFGSLNTSGAVGQVKFTVAGSFGGGDPTGLFSLWVQAKRNDGDIVKVPILLSALSTNGGYFSFTANVRVGVPADYDLIVSTTILQAVKVDTSTGVLDNKPDNVYTFSLPYWFSAEATDQSVTIHTVTAEFV